MKTSHPNYIGLALYRLSGLAFVVCAFSLIAVALMGLALSQKQPTLVAVDDRGRLHGYIEYLDPALRSDEEIQLAITQFTRSWLSVNSATIVADLQLALMMMSAKMAEREKQLLIETNRIAAIQQSQLSARVLIEDLQIERGNGDSIVATVTGQIEAGQNRRPFGILLQARIVARTIHNTLGLHIENLEDL